MNDGWGSIRLEAVEALFALNAQMKGRETMGDVADAVIETVRKQVEFPVPPQDDALEDDVARLLYQVFDPLNPTPIESLRTHGVRVWDSAARAVIAFMAARAPHSPTPDVEDERSPDASGLVFPPVFSPTEGETR